MTATGPQTPAGELSREEFQRYSRHLIMPEVGLDGQKKLKAARVLCVGAGGLGSPLALYLAAAGVGTLGLVDFDVVDLSNLQRQILHGTKDVGRPKLESAAERLKDVNPNVKVVPHEVRLSSDNALDLFRDYDVIADGTDNFPTRYLVNDACVLLGKPNAYASIFRFEGQASVFWAAKGPCYRCLYQDPPPPGLVPSCAEGGVLGILPGLLGVIQATETIKLILGVGESLVGRLLLVDALGMSFRQLKVRKNPDCVRLRPESHGDAAHRLRGVLWYPSGEGRGETRDGRARDHGAGAEEEDGRERCVRPRGRARTARDRDLAASRLGQDPARDSSLEREQAFHGRRHRGPLPHRRPQREGGAIPDGGRLPQSLEPDRRDRPLGRGSRSDRAEVLTEVPLG